MTNTELKNTKNGWFQNFLFWNKKRNNSQNNNLCGCRKTSHLAKTDQSHQNNFNSPNKKEEKMPIFNVNSNSHNKNVVQQSLECPGKVLPLQRRGCGFHVYFCVDNAHKSNYARNKQDKKLQNKQNRTADCFEKLKLDSKIPKETNNVDNKGIGLAKTVRSGNDFSRVVPTKNIIIQGERNVTSDYWRITNHTNNSKGMPSSSPQTAINNVENSIVNDSARECEVQQSNVFETKVINKEKDKCESNSDENPSNGHQFKITENNEKMKQTDGNIKIDEEMRSKDNFPHKSNGTPDNFKLSSNMHDDSTVGNHTQCVIKDEKLIQNSKETPYQTVNQETNQTEHKNSKNTDNIEVGQKKEAIIEEHEMKRSILRTKKATTVDNFTLGGNVQNNPVQKMQCEPTPVNQKTLMSPSYVSDFSTVNGYQDSVEEDILREYETFQKKEKLKRKSTGIKKSRSTFIWGSRKEKQSLTESLPTIMLQISNIENKITELGKACEPKGKSVKNIRNIMGISCNNKKKKHVDKSNEHSSLRTRSKDTVNTTIKIETSDEEILLNSPKTVSITKKIRNGGESRQLVYHNTCGGESRQLVYHNTCGGESRQLVYHNTCELDAHNITLKSLSKIRNNDCKNLKTVQQYPQTNKVVNKEEAYCNMWKKISEELKI